MFLAVFVYLSAFAEISKINEWIFMNFLRG